MVGPDDRELEEFLAGGSRVSRDYRTLGEDEPPPALDAQIRSAAAAAVQPRRPRRAALSWLRPVALAATVVLAVSVMLRLNVQPPTLSRAPDSAGPPVVTVDLGRGIVESQAVVAEPPAPQALNAPAPEIQLPDPADQRADEAAPQADLSATTAFTATARPRAPAPIEETVTVTSRRMESLKEMPLAVSSLEAMPAAAPPVSAEGEQWQARTLAPDTVARALAAIHARIDAENKSVSEGQRMGALRSTDREVSAADARLREILALESSGKVDDVPAALAKFARDFPSDPVSTLLAAGPQ